MKKQLRSGLIAGTALMVLAMSPSWAAPGGVPGPNPDAPGQIKEAPERQIKKAPEIDVGAGGSAIALLVGGLLLAAEKRRRSS